MKRHRIVVELTTDDDAIAELYRNVDSTGRLSDLVEKLVYLHIGGFYSASNVINNSVVEKEEKPEKVASNKEVVDMMNHLKSVIENLSNTVRSSAITSNSSNTVNAIAVDNQVESTPIEHKTVEVLEVAPKKRKGKRDLSKLKKLKGGS